MQIYLTGFMACGKTTVGRFLAAELERPFVDLDEEVERRAGRSVAQIFDEVGAESFRALEQETLVATAAQPGAVVATGGGTFCLEPNRLFMQRSGVTFWLDIPYSEVVRRVGPQGRRDRPLFADEGQARSLYDRRLLAYAQADVRVELDGSEPPAAVVARLALTVREQLCAL